MDYGRPELADRLAAEYVLGTLRGPARRRFESLLAAHPALRAAVRAWEERLGLLADTDAAPQPPAALWAGVERRLFGEAGGQAAAPPATARVPWWDRLLMWRGLTGAAVAALLALVLVGPPVPEPQPPVVVVLQANPEAAAALQAAFVASVSGDGRALVLRPLSPLSPAAGRALELWAVPAQGAPRSLGLVQAAGSTTVLRARLLRDAAALAVSLEPVGGSPTGAPTGPIVSVGKI